MFEFMQKLFGLRVKDLSALSHIEFGQWAERAAEKFLKRKKMKLIAKNYATRFGEIDLIMKDKEFIVFVEVKSTRSDELDPVSHITWNKRKCIIKTAKHFIAKNSLEDVPARFDIVSVIALIQDDGTYNIKIAHEENVFAE